MSGLSEPISEHYPSSVEGEGSLLDIGDEIEGDPGMIAG